MDYIFFKAVVHELIGHIIQIRIELNRKYNMILIKFRTLLNCRYIKFNELKSQHES